jgi:hypothetical protein
MLCMCLVRRPGHTFICVYHPQKEGGRSSPAHTPLGRTQHHKDLAHTVFDERPAIATSCTYTTQGAGRGILDESDDKDDHGRLSRLIYPLLRVRNESEAEGRGCSACSAGESSTQSGEPNKTARQRTLDPDSGGVTDEDLLMFDIEPYLYTAVGPVAVAVSPYPRALELSKA